MHMDDVMSYDQLMFPVIWLGRKDVSTFVDLEHLRTCDYVFWRAGLRKSGCIVDRNLVRRDVGSVRVTGHKSPFWGYRLPGKRILLLDFDFTGGATSIALEELKSMAIRSARASGMYVGMAGSARSYEHSIQKLDSFEAVAKEFQVGPKRGWLRNFWAGPLD